MTVGLSDAGLAERHSPGARGRLSTRQALRRILIGTGARFVEIDAHTVRIVRVRSSIPSPRQQRAVAPIRPSTIPDSSVSQPDIIVTASKQKTRLRDYAGTVSILDLDADKLSRESAQGTASIVARLPMLASTNLGPGRNKIFVRGVADSSFNGSSPATVGQYLGDVRLTYNAPDPDLNLYDIRRVEILEGPQGTLYGTGALGGIIRLVPNAPDVQSNAAALAVGGVTVAHGGQGYDAAGMVNVVIVPDRAAVRAVAYSVVEPGYIDDSSRGLSDINRSKSHGGRAALQLKPGDGWILTIGGAMQNIASRDGQYVLRGGRPLDRRSALSQPFDNDYSLAYLTVTRPLFSAELTTTTSFVRHDVDSNFDATADDSSSPRLFNENIAIRLFSHETRLSRTSADDAWVVGLSGLVSRDRTTRKLGDPSSPLPITGVRNTNSEAAAFGQYSRRIAPDLTATVGGRLSYAHSAGEILDAEDAEASEPTRNQFRFSPTVALSWKINRRLLTYFHAQSAFRPGLLEVAPSEAARDTQRVDADSLSMAEIGVRYGERGHDRLAFGASASIARWTDIQSDLIDVTGLPYTTNIGDGRIMSFEAQASWRMASSLNLEASLFLNNSKLTKPAPQFSAADEKELPNIPHKGARVAASYAHRFDQQTTLTLDGAVRYVGSSDLGIGSPLEVSQGKYFDTAIGARLSHGAAGISIDVTNVLDVRGNRFAYGNPFGIAQQNQITPLVPRRMRVGVDLRF